MRDINIFQTDMFPYLEGDEVKAKPITLTIINIKCEMMKSHRGKDEPKEVLYFRETKKGFVLNKTNAKRIAMMYGSMTGQWAGKQIILTTEAVQAFGELHNALRVSLTSVDTSKDMSLEKLLVTLNKVPSISGFYNAPLEILDCRRAGAEPPDPDDIEGWRVLFADARDYALEKMKQVAENSNMSPDHVDGADQPAPQTTDSPSQSAMDQIEEDAEQPALIDLESEEDEGRDMDDHYGQMFES